LGHTVADSGGEVTGARFDGTIEAVERNEPYSVKILTKDCRAQEAAGQNERFE
jgi:hypothetical protein